MSRFILGSGLVITLLSITGCHRDIDSRYATPAPYSSIDKPYVDAALDAYTSYGKISKAQALHEVYPVVVTLPKAVCVGLNPRPGWADGGATVCYDSENGNLLTYYQPGLNLDGQHVPPQLIRPHHGVIIGKAPPRNE